MRIEIKVTNWKDDSTVDFILSPEHARRAVRCFLGNQAAAMRQMVILLTETFYDSAILKTDRADDKTDLKEPAEKNIA